MRHIFTSTHFVLLAFLFLSKPLFSQQGPAQKGPTSAAGQQGPTSAAGLLAAAKEAHHDLPNGISGDWYSKAVTAIEDREYAITELDRARMYGAINHAQHLGYGFSVNGYSVKSFNEDGSEKNIWQAQFLLTGIGRGKELHRKPLINVSQSGDHCLRFDHGSYTVQYENQKAGMEQSFLLKKRPAGNTPLRITMQLEGGLDARIGRENTLELYTSGHPEDIKLVYDQLKVWDKNHKSLPAHMTLTADHRLTLTVDDRNAVYPVTVDPFAHGASATYIIDNTLGTAYLDASVHTLYGYSVSGAGDVDGNGFQDIIIGAPTYARITAFASGTLSLNVGVTATGAAFIYFGSLGNEPLATPSIVLQPSGLAAGALFGFSVSSTGNAGGGGTHSGVVVGAPGAQATFNYLALGGNVTVAVGSAYVFTSNLSGAVTLVNTPDAVLVLNVNDFNIASTPGRNPMTGFSVADAGDVDGDNIDDIIVGSPLYNDLSSFGRVDIYKGSASGVSSTPQTTIKGAFTGEFFGFSVNSAGKVNNDAIADVIVGAPGDLVSSSVTLGAAYVIYGKSGGISTMDDGAVSGTIGTKLTDPNTVPGTFFGFSVSSAGDVDNDTHDDVIVGAPLTITAGGANGKAYIYYGSGTATGIASPSRPFATLTSPRAAPGLNLLFGFSVANAGNVTGDGAGDVLVGEPGSLPLTNAALNPILFLLGLSNANNVTGGQVYAYAGASGANINPAIYHTFSSTGTNLFGYSVHGAGDVDGDGHPDFIIGQPSGVLDLGFNLTSRNSLLSGGPLSLVGTLTLGSGNGLLTMANTGNTQLIFGFTGTLPVTLLDFTGKAEANDVLLDWSTALEQNSSYFQIERSQDNQHFTAIGKVTSVHNSSAQTNYSYTDASPALGNNYYRLNLVDLDGTSVYSKVVVVNFNNPTQHLIATYPNPTQGSFQLVFKNMTPGRYAMNLLNATGQTVLVRNIQVADPQTYSETVNLNPTLAKGTYLIRVVDQQNHSFVTRIVVK